MVTVAEIYERDPEQWDQLDLDTIVTMLRQEALAFAEAEAKAASTGKKVRSQKPAFTRGRSIGQSDMASLDDIKVEL